MPLRPNNEVDVREEHLPRQTRVVVQEDCPEAVWDGAVFLHYDRGLMWQTFFTHVYPVILTEGHETSYVPLIQMFQQAAVDDSSHIMTARPVDPLRNAHFIKGELPKDRGCIVEIKDLVLQSPE